MADSHILEVTIASDDHRMLSANAEAWWLVQNDVFVPFESFLTDESRRVFLPRLETGDSSWFLVSFAKEPSTAYLTRIEADASVPSAAPRGDGPAGSPDGRLPPSEQYPPELQCDALLPGGSVL